MMEPLPSEEPVPPAEEGAQIQGHWVVVLGQDTAPVLLVLQGMLQVLPDRVRVLLVLQDRALVLQDRAPEGQGTPGTPQEPVAGCPRRANLGAGGQRERGCCQWARRRITGDREERRRVRWVTLIPGSA